MGFNLIYAPTFSNSSAGASDFLIDEIVPGLATAAPPQPLAENAQLSTTTTDGHFVAQRCVYRALVLQEKRKYRHT